MSTISASAATGSQADASGGTSGVTRAGSRGAGSRGADSRGADAAALERDWLAWRAARHAGLRDPRGVLSLVAHHWLGAAPAGVHGLPGLWWTAPTPDGTAAHVRVEAGQGTPPDAVLLDAQTLEPVEGERVVTVAEAGSVLPFVLAPRRPGLAVVGPASTGLVAGQSVGAGLVAEELVAVEVALRTGRHLVRLRDPRSAALARAAGTDPVPSFPFDPALVLALPVRWYDAPRADRVDGAKPGLVHDVRVLGEVDLPGPGSARATLRVTAGHGGGATVSFTDTADGTPAWRAVHVPAADVEAARASGVLRVDLNRATAYPSHFNDHGTCPRPLAGNAVPFAVRAGEKDPR